MAKEYCADSERQRLMIFQPPPLILGQEARAESTNGKHPHRQGKPFFSFYLITFAPDQQFTESNEDCHCDGCDKFTHARRRRVASTLLSTGNRNEETDGLPAPVACNIKTSLF